MTQPSAIGYWLYWNKSRPEGLGQWDGRALAEALGASVHAVWRLLRREGIYLQRLRTWCVSTDPELAPNVGDHLKT